MRIANYRHYFGLSSRVHEVKSWVWVSEDRSEGSWRAAVLTKCGQTFYVPAASFRYSLREAGKVILLADDAPLTCKHCMRGAKT